MDETRHVVMDAGPLIDGAWPVDAAGAPVRYYTVPDVLRLEIRDAATRARLAAPGARPLDVRVPSAAGLAAVRAAAADGGDAAVLSAADVQLLALTWDLSREHAASGDGELAASLASLSVSGSDSDAACPGQSERVDTESKKTTDAPSDAALPGWDGEWASAAPRGARKGKTESEDKESSDSAPDHAPLPTVACATVDYAMQNVLLRLRLVPLGHDGRRVSALRAFLLRCHACFWTTLDFSKRFCGRCGGPTLLRASYTQHADGTRAVHLQARRVWSTRGTVAPVSYRAGLVGPGRAAAGGVPLLREDQREYVAAMEAHRRAERRAAAGACAADPLAPDAPAVPAAVPLPVIGFGRRNPNASRRR